jgi:hypothetical protein
MLLKLLGLPVSVPMAGWRFCINQLIEMAEQEMLDDGPVREALLLLTLQLEEGDVDEAEYVAREAELMQWMREIRAYKEQRARAQAGLEPADDPGGPVVVSLGGGGFQVEFHDQYERPTGPAAETPRS